MANKRKGKLELNWVDKGDIILTKFDENGKTYPASYFNGQVSDEELMPRELELVKSVGDPDSENMLIQGENLIALRSLEREYAGRIKLIYIDPPFNTGQDFEHYEDGLEHSIWLTMMENRLRLAKNILRNDGVVLVHIDNNEVGHLRVLMDEIFSKNNFVQMISEKRASPAGFKTINPGPLTVTDYILMFARDKDTFISKWKPYYVPVDYDENYDLLILNYDDPPIKWKFKKIHEILYAKYGFKSWRDAKREWGHDWKVVRKSLCGTFVLENADRVVSIRDPHKPSDAIRELLEKSKEHRRQVFVLKREKYNDIYIINGGALSFYKNKIREIDGEFVPTEILTDLWDDINYAGIAEEGKVQFKNSKKPEMLLKRIIEMTTEPGDYVMDYFLGSGTTAAVAHKLNRKWIGIELGEHAEKLCLPRLRRVVSGEDKTGVSKQVGWKGGGGFKFYKLGEPLIVRHKDYPSIKVINPKYYNTALIKVICNLEGFKFRKDDKIFHGINKLGNKFAHITEQYVSQGYIGLLKSKLTDNEELVVYCFNYDDKIALPQNVLIKKLPDDLGKPYQLRLRI